MTYPLLDATMFVKSSSSVHFCPFHPAVVEDSNRKKYNTYPLHQMLKLILENFIFLSFLWLIFEFVLLTTVELQFLLIFDLGENAS